MFGWFLWVKKYQPDKQDQTFSTRTVYHSKKSFTVVLRLWLTGVISTKGLIPIKRINLNPNAAEHCVTFYIGVFILNSDKCEEERSKKKKTDTLAQTHWTFNGGRSVSRYVL